MIDINARVTKKRDRQRFHEIQQGQTFYRKVGHHLWTMVKAPGNMAVMVEDAPASMRGEATPYWELDPEELMLSEAQYMQVKKDFPDGIITSGPAAIKSAQEQGLDRPAS